MVDGLKYKRKNPFVILSHNFIKWGMLNWNEKDIYIILLMYADSEQKCFPSINTLCKVSRKSNKTVIRALKGLEEKHLLKKETRITKNGQSSNLYTLYDFESVWEAESIEQVPDIVSIETKRKQLYELAQELNYIIKEKEPESLQADQSNNDSSTQINNIDINNNIIKGTKSQLERYTIDQIKQLFDYNVMVQENPYQQQDIDSVMDILYTTMNTTKATIRVAGEDKPSMVVIGKLMKLHNESIMYAINKYLEQASEIKNPVSYMLTILYSASEQYHLTSQNQIAHNNAPVEKSINRKPIDIYTSFPQRKYDYELLEKELLSGNRDTE